MENTTSSTKSSNTPAYIAFTASLFVGILGFSASIWATYHSGQIQSKLAQTQAEIQNKVVQRQTETQLLLNVYSLTDSAQIVQRLQTYLNLNLFSPATKAILDSMLKNHTFLPSNKYIAAEYIADIGSWTMDSVSGASFYIQSIHKNVDSKISVIGVIRRPENDPNQKYWNDPITLPNSWSYQTSNGTVYGLNLKAIENDSLHCLFQVQVIK